METYGIKSSRIWAIKRLLKYLGQINITILILFLFYFISLFQLLRAAPFELNDEQTRLVPAIYDVIVSNH